MPRNNLRLHSRNGRSSRALWRSGSALLCCLLAGCGADNAETAIAPAPTIAAATATAVPTPTALPTPTIAPSPTVVADTGRLVDVGGYRMFLRCGGAGSSTVVLDSGLGDTSAMWDDVQPALEGSTRVCSYDRAGRGRSEAGPTPRTSASIAKELHTLLANAGETGPFVLVGHSFGGLNMRLFASRYPDNVRGLVLVDALPDLDVMFIRSLLTGRDLAQLDLFLNENYEGVDLVTSLSEARALNLGDLPVRIITHGRSDPTALGMTIENAGVAELVWQLGQQRLQQLSSQSALLVARESGHAIPSQQPEIVLDAVRELLAAS